MLVVHGRDAGLTLQELMQVLQLKPDEVDMEYGAQLIDPAAGDYVILVEESVAGQIDPQLGEISGPYSDPVIETFGPPQK